MKYEEFLENASPQRGDVWFANLPKVGGNVQSGHRPVIVVSNNKGNEHSNIIEVVPMTSSLTKANIPTHFIFKKEDVEGTVLCEQVHTISQDNLDKYKFHLSEDDIALLDECLSVSLELNCKDNQSSTCTSESTDELIETYDDAILKSAVEYINTLKYTAGVLSKSLNMLKTAESEFSIVVGGSNAAFSLSDEAVEKMKAIALNDLTADVNRNYELLNVVMQQCPVQIKNLVQKNDKNNNKKKPGTRKRSHGKVDIGKLKEYLAQGMSKADMAEKLDIGLSSVYYYIKLIEKEETTVDTVDNDVDLEKMRIGSLDLGKMLALRKAGWSNKAIADELRTTKEVVSNAFTKYSRAINKRAV